MRILSIESKRSTRIIIENYYLIVFFVYFGSIYLSAIRTGITMTALLLYLLFNSRLRNNGNIYSQLLFVFAIYCVLSILGYTYNGISLIPYFAEFSNQLLPMMLFFIPPGIVNEERYFNRSAIGIALSLLVGLYFWYDSPSYYIDFVKKIGDAEYDQKLNTLGLRFQSIYGSIITGTLCVYLVILSSFRLFYNNLKIKEKLLNILFFILGVSCGMLTQQRSAMVVIIALIFIPFFNVFIKRAKLNKLYTYLIVILIFFIILYLIPIIPDYIDRFIYRLNEIQYGLSDRDDQWKIALAHNPNPITGIGLGSSGHKAQGYYQYLVFDGAYWKILNEVGVAGFLIMFIPILGILSKGLSNYQRLYRCYMIVISIMIQSFASNTLCFMLTTPMFWFALRTINQDRKNHNVQLLKEKNERED